MNDQLAADLLKQVTRIAEALHVLVAKQTQVVAPNLFRPIEDFPAFDWEHEIPGCRIIARDRSGPTEVSYEGHTYRRYRSSDEDVKGTDIRYRCVVSGTVAEKNLVWATLIKFGEPRKVKPLSSAVREKIEERTAQHAPAPQPTATPAAAAPAVTPQPSAAAPIEPVPTPITTEIKKFIDGRAKGYAEARRDANENQRTMVFLLLKEVSHADEAKRHTLQTKLTGFEGFNDIPGVYILALIDWLKPYSNGDKKHHPNAARFQDVEQIVKEALLAAGQQALM